MKLLVYASNLHVGGGLQVATSVINELSCLDLQEDEVTIWASSEVDCNLNELQINKSSFTAYEVIDHFGIKARWAKERNLLKSFDKVLVIFGPHYLGELPVPVAVGFAQAWIIYKNSEAYDLLTLLGRFRTKLKFSIQEYLFKQSDMLIVELEHVKTGLIRNQIMTADRIKVIHNCISSIFQMPSLWQSLVLPEKKKPYRLGFLGRNYVHKNTAIFPEVLKLLNDVHGLSVELLVTFTDQEWDQCSQDFRDSVINVGPLDLTQCPEFYKCLDGLLFPSLLECFSATPLEAMAMLCPIFVSDRPFMHDICKEYAKYINPISPQHIAEVLASSLKSKKDQVNLQEAKNYAISFSSPQDRAKGFLKCVKEVKTH